MENSTANELLSIVNRHKDLIEEYDHQKYYTAKKNACALYLDAKELWQKAKSYDSDYQIIDIVGAIAVSYGLCLYALLEYPEAIDIYKEAAEAYTELDTLCPGIKVIKANLATVYNNIAFASKSNYNFRQAAEYFKKAAAIYKDLEKEDYETYHSKYLASRGNARILQGTAIREKILSILFGWFGKK
jgi:tetratricopeptide (TPR) repeat protein